MRRFVFVFAFALTLCCAVFCRIAPAQDASATGQYKVIKTAKVGGEGRFDYVYADSDGRRLYIPRVTARDSDAKSRVDVFDLDTLATVGTIAGTNAVHGVAVDPQSGHGFASSNPIVMFDTKTLATIKTIATDASPDGIFFEPQTQRVYVLSHKSPNATVLDPKDGSVVGTVDLGGEPEQAQSDGNGHVFIDLEDQDQIAVVDANSLKVTAHYGLDGKGGGPAGLGLDAKNHILFAFCHEPAVCVVMNAEDGKVITTLPIGNGVDGGGFNPNTMEAFSSQGDGTMTIIKENSPTDFAVEQTVKTLPGAKTCTLDSKTNNIYTITAEWAPVPTQPNGQEQANNRRPRRGPMIPGSFTILVVGKQ